ncbi:TPA: hypothetical protein NJ132_000382 [Vibrio parahaemolyticus]|nr:hypothetical protein [Vibrio parahaemolyticus]HCE1695181.1 hypothetical protein [Vibrio parahaemolyticus]HCE1699840.1 hypothetical protein [Vibrio parahaemolyticus]HCE3048984.1 hypothetical protein [Vibrio parahaemolyticus]HCE3053132.1 hypothetical protein [Vibrio parahaemolyticus]
MSEAAVERFQSALERLLDGKPERVKASGRLTLNKINREAGFGQSYIHKFKKFIEEIANPAIKKYNRELDNPQSPQKETSEQGDMSEIDKLRAELEREKELKDKYRKELNDVKKINKELETLNKSLMFRVYELQEEFGERVYEIAERKK